VTSNHGAFDPTKMCSVGRMEGVSTSEPIATCTKAPSRTTEKSSYPQTTHRLLFAFSSPTIKSVSCPAVIASFFRSMPANVLKAVPVAARHREQ
jgi:hypothetical protein